MKLIPEIYHMIIVLGVILFGSIVHATSQLKIARDKKLQFNAVDFWILFLLASFAGSIFGMIALILFDNQIIVVLFSAIGAFLGMAGLNRVASILLDVLSSKIDRK